MRHLTRCPLTRSSFFPKPTAVTNLRPFSTSLQCRLRENAEQDPDDLEKKKQQAAQTGEKSRDLKSEGEEAVGADQEKVKDDQKHIEELQKQTANESQKEKEGKK